MVSVEAEVHWTSGSGDEVCSFTVVSIPKGYVGLIYNGMTHI